MKEVKTKNDITALQAGGAREEVVALTARRLSEIQVAFAELDAIYDPDSDGHIVVLEPGDDLESITGISPLSRIPDLAESLIWHGNESTYELTICPSNSWCWTYLVPAEAVSDDAIGEILSRFQEEASLS